MCDGESFVPRLIENIYYVRPHFSHTSVLLFPPIIKEYRCVSYEVIYHTNISKSNHSCAQIEELYLYDEDASLQGEYLSFELY